MAALVCAEQSRGGAVRAGLRRTGRQGAPSQRRQRGALAAGGSSCGTRGITRLPEGSSRGTGIAFLKMGVSNNCKGII